MCSTQHWHHSETYRGSQKYGSRCTITQQPSCVLCLHPTGYTSASRSATLPTGAGFKPDTPMDVAQLEAALQHYTVNCVAPSTRTSYATAQRRYLAFCSQAGIPQPWPVAVDILCRYVTHLGLQGLKHKTIKVYLSGLRFTHIHLGLGNPFYNEAMPQLEYVVTGIKRVQACQAAPPLARLPVTVEIMGQLHSVWLTKQANVQGIMLWAAACVGFFGFLRAGEFTIPSSNAYDPEVHLSLADVALDSHTAPSMVRLRIKQSKTDPFRVGVDVFLGATHTEICPVRALIQFLAVRSPDPGPLFLTHTGTPLTRAVLVKELQSALEKVGIPPSQYNGHSFRIGAATTAAKCGFEDSRIQTLGRWKSGAYRTYIRIPRQELAATSAALLGRSNQ